LATLHAQGVDQAVVLAEEAPAVSGMVTSEAMIDYARDTPGLFAFVCPNPFTDNDLAGRLDDLTRYGPVHGIKLLPSYQLFWPNDARMYPLYDRAQQLGLPVTFHTGTSVFPGTRLKYAQPLLLDDVAVDFPRLSILLAHSGRGPWYQEAAVLATLHENVYLELSGLPARNLPRYFPDYKRLVDKMVFGSDFPGLPSVRENIVEIQRLFGLEDARTVLWENGARLLGLQK
jgi:predicted TIM-barrel fold metal-dependent hydrolase